MLTSPPVTIVESTFGLDGGAMFGIVPRPLWMRKTTADEQNRIPMAARCWLLDTPNHRVLVDTGMGDNWGEKEKDIYNVSPNRGGIRGALREAGTDPESITDVLMTHLHFDHAGGLVVRGDDGEMAPALPAATVHVQRANWTWAQRPSPRDAGSYKVENFMLLGAPKGSDLRLLDGTVRLFDDAVEVWPHFGHTPGMQLVKARYEGQTFVYCADLIPTRAHIPIPWVMGYDLDPVRTCAEKEQLLEAAARENWILVLQHEPDLPVIRVERTARGGFQVAGAWASCRDALARD